MRILHVYDQYVLSIRGGGVERYIHHLAYCFSTMGHEVTIAARQIAPMPGAPYRILRATPRQLLREIWAADRVHIHGPRNWYAALAGLMSLSLRVPLFYTLHCFYRGKTRRQKIAKYLWDQLVERLLLAQAHSLVLSEYWHTYLQARGLPTRKVRLLPNGIDAHELQQPASKMLPLAGSPALLSVSRLDPVKCIDDTIAALAQPGLEHAHLHIVGEGTDKQRLQNRAQQMGVADRVTFHGFTADAEVAAMASPTAVFVLASAEEGMPTTILEMLARRVPVVASAIPGNLSLTQTLGWHFTYPLHDIPALSAAIRRAMQTQVPTSLLEELREHFDWQPIGRRLMDLYQAAQ